MVEDLPGTAPGHPLPRHLRPALRQDRPQGFRDFFARWVEELAASLPGNTVAIDGKTLRGSLDQANQSAAIHLVSAWAADIRLVLGQLKTADKSTEITAIPELINTLDLQGAIISLDARGCQKNIAQSFIPVDYRGTRRLCHPGQKQPEKSP